MNSTTLTKDQIKALAVLAGFYVQDITGTSGENEFVICNGSINSSQQNEFNGLIAYNKEKPNDGAVPLK